MKIKIPDNLKSDVPQTRWGKVLVATPVIMTVIATALAGLASSEMTRAQYSRSRAAQEQSKAGDQWGFFQAKRLRGALQRSTLDLLHNTTDLSPLEVASLLRLDSSLDSPVGRQALAALLEGQLPDATPRAVGDPQVKAALEAMHGSSSEAENAPLILRVSETILADELRAAKEQTSAFDATMQPLGRIIDRLEGQLTGTPAAPRQSPAFVAARLQYSARRYDAEARLNQAVAVLYELQVARSNLDAERHHVRSQRFFFGMLAAQAAVIIATFAIAAQKRNLLWGLSAAAGASAIFFAAYVYLFV